MFEAHIQDIIARCTVWSIGGADTILLKEIIASPLPRSITRYFEIEAEVWIADEKQRLVASPHFRYSDDRVLAHFDTIIDMAPEYATFERADFLGLIDTAVKLQFNYACRPEWTLARYVFADTDHASADTILRAMSVFTDYTYFHAVLAEYFERRNVDHLHRDRFVELLALVDDELVRSCDASALTGITEPLFRLFSPDGDPEHIRIPLDALVIFFDDKRMRMVVDRLEEERAVARDLSMHGLSVLLEDVDFHAGADISELVNRHMTGEASVPVPSVPYDLTDSYAGAPTSPDILDGDRSDAFADAGDSYFSRSVQEGVIGDSFVDMGDGSVAVPAEQTGYADDADDSLYDLPSGYDVLLPEEVGGSLTRIATDDDAAAMAGDSASDGTFDEASFSFDRNTPVIPREEDDILGGEQVTPAFDDAELLGVSDISSWFAENSDDEDDDEGAPQAASAVEDPFLEELNLEEEDSLPMQPSSHGYSTTDIGLSTPGQPARDVDEIPDFELPDEAGETIAVPSAAAPTQPMFAGPGTDLFATTAPVEEVVARLGDIRARISVADKKKYVKKIFNRDAEAYEQAMDAINARGSWREASELIDDVFIRFNIDMYSRIAVKFTDDIYRRYTQTKG